MTTKELIRAEIERLIRMNQTKRGFPAGTACAIRIEAYQRILDFLDTLPDESEQPTRGYKQAQQDIIARIQSRIDGILGDAQPAPILRMELNELIEKINQ